MQEMRRKDRQVSEEQAMAIVRRAEYGVVSSIGADGEPYGVPLVYALDEDTKSLLFHCAREGRKYRNFTEHPAVHFVTVAETQVQGEEFTIEFQSAMLNGNMEEVTDTEEKIRCAQRIAQKYSSRDSTNYATKTVDHYTVFRLSFQTLTGKCLAKSGKPGMGKE